jgi:hypothetical protein
MTIHDNIPIYQWEGLDIHFGCTYKGVRYWRTHGTGTDSDKWDICYDICLSWRKIGTPIPPLQYLVITGEHFDIERIIEEANRNERPE